MAIKNEDLIILKSERMTQFEDGGGSITGLELQNNKSNEVFPDVTAIDRVAGKLEYAKLFSSVKTYGDPMTDENGQPINGTDGEAIIVPETLQAAGIIITRNPTDENINALLFTTTDHYDEVKDIKNRIESYMIKTVRISGEIVGRQPKGSKMLRMAQKPGAQPPKAGDTVCIVQDEGTVSQIEEYLKIEKVESTLQDVMVQAGNSFVNMPMNMLNISLYYPLENDYDAGEITGNDSARMRTILRAAQVNDATSYKGAQNLTEPTSIGDLRLRVKSVFGQLAPPSEGQANIVDMTAGSDSSPLVASGGAQSFTTNQDLGNGSQIFVGIGVLPGTLRINYNGGTLQDVGGQIMSGETPVGTINYGRGLVMFSMSSPIFSGSKTFTYTAATLPQGAISQTEAIAINESNRSDTYNINLFPAPEPGGLTVDYVAMGSRYRLRDRGDGILESDGAGVGLVDYRTGSVSVTLAAAPDANTAIIFSFSNKVDYMNRGADFISGNIPASLYQPKITKQLNSTQLMRGNVSLSWNDGEDRTIQDDGLGKISGHGLTGEIDYITGVLSFYFASGTKSKGTRMSVTYQKAGTASVKNESLSGYAVTAGTQRVQLENGNLRPRGVRVEFNVMASKDNNNYGYDILTATVTAFDDGKGNLITTGGANAGTVDYATGLLNIVTRQNVMYWVPLYSYRQPKGQDAPRYAIYGHEQRSLSSAPPSNGTQFIDIQYTTAGEDLEEHEEFLIDSYTINLTPQRQEYIVPGSVQFNFSGKNYYDIDGALYSDLDRNTGAGVFSGIVNYQNGSVNLLNWNDGGSAQINVRSLLTMLNYLPVSGLDFIIPTAPIRPGSFMIRATREDGVRLEATAGENGEINAQSMRGKIDNRTGVVRVDFGALVPIEGNEDAEWFDVQNIQGDKVWQPYLVMIDTIKYNVVSTTFSPVDPEVLGISLVRLPIDGRVPIYKNGDLVVLHETLTQVVPLNAPIGHVINFNVDLVSNLYLQDANEKKVDCKQYKINKINGTIEIIDNDFSGYVQPLTACALIEEENSVTDVQITGLVSLRKPIRHRFTTGALLSGVAYIGDMQSRYTNLFEQSTWQTNEWSDIPSGRPNWRYNDTEYPLKLTNADTVQERWALLFNTSTTFNIYGENLGLIGVGSTASDCAPINPNTKSPYFILKKEGWGQGGQASGNVLRFNTIAANQPFWLTRSVIPSDDTAKGDSFSFRFRGFKSGDN